MPQQAVPQVENNFTKGLMTEFTGLNFPENAATDTDNCVYTLVGNVTRREGFDYEDNFALKTINRSSAAINTYKWNNVGGDGQTQLLVQQTGGTLYFYTSSAATIASPLSTKILVSTVSVSSFAVSGGTFDATIECQFADGNGYLFVYHPTCEPFYCTYMSGSVSALSISLQIRDFSGIPENGVPVTLRPAADSIEHFYNLINQGWTSSNPWFTNDTTTTQTVSIGLKTFTVPSSISGITGGQQVQIFADTNPTGGLCMIGNVSSYTGTSLVINITATYAFSGFTLTPGSSFLDGVSYNMINWGIFPVSNGYISTWVSALGNYPSNADVWWYFKDDTDSFNPATTASSVTLATGNAPQGHVTLSAFNQIRSAYSPGVTDTVTKVRPRTGTWFQGRVWYAGVDASQNATGDAGYYTWTENIYFSQIVQSPVDFGTCYQTNDPTAENLFDLLPTDGGVVIIQGSGAIYKLFPIQNGMLVFAANGVWFITGSQGIGFSANDYTITKISAVQSISGTSYVDVNGLPYFWNEEGIYMVSTGQQGQLNVEPLTVGTILSFYNNIPMQSKKYARGAYHPIDYTLQFIYKSTNETSVTNRYDFDSLLNFNTYNKAFYPYSFIDVTGDPHICGINYIAGPGGTTSPDPVFKYLTNASNGSGSWNFTFSEENDDTFTDFVSFNNVGFNYVSYFVTGYRLTGQAQRRVQIPYIYTFSRGGLTPTSFYLQSIWDYATSGNSGRWSTQQQINSFDPNYAVIPRRTRLRGQGLVLQLKVTSVDGQLFDIMGWSTFTSTNTGV